MVKMRFAIFPVLALMATAVSSIGISLVQHWLPPISQPDRVEAKLVEVPGEGFVREWHKINQLWFTEVFVAPVESDAGWTPGPVSIEAARKSAPSWSIVLSEWPPFLSSREARPDVYFRDVAFGIPFRCLQLRVQGDPLDNLPFLEPSSKPVARVDARGVRYAETVLYGWDWSGPILKIARTLRQPIGNGFVPAKILWWGLLADISFYIATFWLLWTARNWYVDRRRQRCCMQLLCSKCGYPEVQGGMCPECGMATSAVAPLHLSTAEVMIPGTGTPAGL